MTRQNEATAKARLSYAVGYGRPPIATRFRPGQSGNPGGRSKGVRNTASLAHEALESKVDVAENGAGRKITVRQSAYRQLAEKAASGDMKALSFLLALENKERPESDYSEAHMPPEQILQILQSYLTRVEPAGGQS